MAVQSPKMDMQTVEESIKLQITATWEAELLPLGGSPQIIKKSKCEYF
jgi:hypothetical protein